MAAFTLQPVDGVDLTVLVDNVTDSLMVDMGPAKRVGMTSANAPRLPAPTLDTGETIDALLAEHGLSVLLTVRRDGAEHRILFDTGITPNGMIENMRRLSLSPKDVEVVVLSHGHFDHTSGLSGFIAAVGRTNLPVIIHPDFWTKRRIAIPGRDPVELPSTSRAALIGAGFDIIEERAPSFLFDGSVLITGEVERTTDFERGFPVHEAHRDGAWQPDPLILDDQAIVLQVRDRGLVVLTGCGHAGIVNIVRRAQALTGVDKLYAVIGGFHLNGPLFEPIIDATCEALVASAPQYIVPAHCTGWRAQQALAMHLPDAYVPNSVGTRFEL